MDSCNRSAVNHKLDVRSRNEYVYESPKTPWREFDQLPRADLQDLHVAQGFVELGESLNLFRDGHEQFGDSSSRDTTGRDKSFRSFQNELDHDTAFNDADEWMRFLVAEQQHTKHLTEEFGRDGLLERALAHEQRRCLEVSILLTALHKEVDSLRRQKFDKLSESEQLERLVQRAIDLDQCHFCDQRLFELQTLLETLSLTCRAVIEARPHTVDDKNLITFVGGALLKVAHLDPRFAEMASYLGQPSASAQYSRQVDEADVLDGFTRDLLKRHGRLPTNEDKELLKEDLEQLQKSINGIDEETDLRLENRVREGLTAAFGLRPDDVAKPYLHQGF